MNKLSKYTIANAIAILFHVIGLLGMLFYDRELFAAATPVHLLLMFALILYTQKAGLWFYLFAAFCICAGIAVEIIGTQTGWLFGSYNYGKVLGPSFMNVPLIIGVNWLIVIYCCGITVHMLLNKVTEKIAIETGKPRKALRAASVIADGALLAVFFDWVLEPVAVKLGYWQWAGNDIPFYNYVSWYVVSTLLLACFHFMPFHKSNKFAVNLLLIQIMFFLLLRTLL